MQLTLGPIPFFWPKEQILAFYECLQDQPVERIYIGETICSKRREMRTQDWLDLAQMLREQGKEVVLSTLTLIEAESELKQLKRLCAQGQFLVEANDMGAVQLLSQQHVPFVTGSAINIYNGRSLRRLQQAGMQRWNLPVELSQNSLRDTLSQAKELTKQALPEVEILAYGYLPLAYAARCFTARHRNLAKDDCGFCCIEYPQGIPLTSQNGESLFIMNGIQTMSAKRFDLLDQVSTMRDIGVDALRISPTQTDMSGVIARFHQAITEPQSMTTNAQHINLVDADSHCNGYWFGQPGMDQRAIELNE
ncbi:MAG: U32 family peptidase [Gammaproteobacteria bacterium]|nr:U32 family peptidase [Gammaproteobacteria bacterium]